MRQQSLYSNGADAISTAVLRPAETNNNSALKVVKSPACDPEITREMVNSITHGLGVLFGIAAIPLLTTMAVRTNHMPAIAGACVYGFSFLLVFTASTVYHGLQQPAVKRVLEIVDHISIYFLIAGTYTPLILRYMYNTTGIIMLWVLWGLAFAGMFFKIYFGCRFNIVSTIVYLLMGWMMVWTGGDFFKAMPGQLITLIIAGGIVYTTGVIFFLWERWRWHHAVWHLCALGGAVCHYAAVLQAVT
jgi:hemolysin III